MSLGEDRHVAPRSPAPVLTIQPQPQADERERQADAGREENEIFRHLLSLGFVAHCCFKRSARCS